ncbi:hypothetical protein [Bdellovibrio sp. NC01]|uniref:hypothetical protein n=1 Tax=Bdellovibrio sp. NC01 TaxID=2220073 RepID=UPI00115749C6|nr:hypothetical protein [Bdellovibrio sp. NC01]QDK37557.1 hypothetical protein DOE51_08155 [Bdellovibrio sp. NC01]
MRLFIFSERLAPELREKSVLLRKELPDVLKEVEEHPAEVANSRVDAILALIGLIQRYKCNLSVYQEDGLCITDQYL